MGSQDAHGALGWGTERGRLHSGFSAWGSDLTEPRGLVFMPPVVEGKLPNPGVASEGKQDGPISTGSSAEDLGPHGLLFSPPQNYE